MKIVERAHAKIEIHNTGKNSDGLSGVVTHDELMDFMDVLKAAEWSLREMQEDNQPQYVHHTSRVDQFGEPNSEIRETSGGL